MDWLYLDNNATTRPDPQVVAVMRPYLEDLYGNPSSQHRLGQLGRQAIDIAREQVAALIGCSAGELSFTGGGTESINMAIRGLLTTRWPRKTILTSSVEHSATRELCAALAREGAVIDEIPVDFAGRLALDALAARLDDSVALVTLLWANNETGAIFPVERIAALCREKKIPFHCDGTQAVGKLPVKVNEIGLDTMSFAAHKFHGPKGVGGLFVRRGVRVRPLIIGGPQEKGRRGGTENVPGIVGMGKAAELAGEWLGRMGEVARRRDWLESEILRQVSDAAVNSADAPRLPNTSNIGFPRLEADAILLLLSEAGLCASAGAACASGSLEPSHVLRAMGIDPKLAHGSVRFSLSRFTTDEEIRRTVELVPRAIARLRQVLPVG